jgi:hypothetical protein
MMTQPKDDGFPPIPELASTHRATWTARRSESTSERYLREYSERQAWSEHLRLAEESQRVRHGMEVREITHLGELAAARDAIVADAVYRRELAAHLALTTREAFEDHARERAQWIEDSERERAHWIEDSERERREQLIDRSLERQQRFEDYDLTRPRVVSEQHFDLEVQEREYYETRTAWSDADALRARTQAEAVDDYTRSRPEAVAAHIFAIERAQRARQETRLDWNDADEDRPIRREEAKARRIRATRDDILRREQEETNLASGRLDYAPTQGAEFGRRARKEEADTHQHRAGLRARERDERLAEMDLEIELAERQAKLDRLRQPPAPRDQALEALRHDCERIALDVSTDTVLFGEENLYHGFAALKYHEARQTLDPDDAIEATVAALIWRRNGQRELTMAEARAFVDQYHRLCGHEATDEGYKNVKSVLEQFGIGTEDTYEDEA